MQIGGDDFRLGVVELLEVGNDTPERIVRLFRFQIADVLAEENLIADGEGDGVFQMCSDGKEILHFRFCIFNFNRQRRVAASAAQNHFTVQHHAHDRIIHMADDGAVVDQKHIGDVAQAFKGLAFICANRFVAQVAARGHDRKAQFCQQQMVERRVRQHHAEVWIARGNGIPQRMKSANGFNFRMLHPLALFIRWRCLPQQNDGRFRRTEQAFFQRRHFTNGFHVFERREQECQRLFLALFALAQTANSAIVSRIHHQMKSAEALDRDDLTRANGFGGGEQDFVAALGRARQIFFREKIGGVLPNATAPEFELRPADRTRVRLRVKPAVERIVVFHLARGTHLKRLHRGVRPVVGQRFDDAEARTAIRAVRERIPIAAVRRIKNLAQTIGTRRDVRQHQRGLFAAGFARADFESVVAGWIEPRAFQALDGTARRFFGFEAKEELFQRRGRAFDFDADALRRVVHPAVQLEFRRQPKDERTKADPLNRAANGEPQALARVNGCSFLHTVLLRMKSANGWIVVAIVHFNFSSVVKG